MGFHFTSKSISWRSTFLTIAAMGTAVLGSSSTGCGRVYPSYSGVYRLKESSQPLNADRLGGAAFVNWPKTLTAYQHPFEKANGIASTQLALGSTEKFANGVFTLDGALSDASKDTVEIDVIAPQTFPDFQSSPIIDPGTGLEQGPSCLYTYGALATFAVTPGVRVMTDSSRGVYPAEHTEVINGKEVVLSNPGPWSNQGVYIENWEKSPKEILVEFSIFKRPAYRNLGTCHYGSSYVPQNPASYVFTARYELETEIDSGDPREPRTEAEIQTSLQEVFGASPSVITRDVFEAPINANALRSLF